VQGGDARPHYNVRFDSKARARDRVYDYDGCASSSIPSRHLLKGMVLDWEETLLQRQFVFKNPNASKSVRVRDQLLGIMTVDDRRMTVVSDSSISAPQSSIVF